MVVGARTCLCLRHLNAERCRALDKADRQCYAKTSFDQLSEPRTSPPQLAINRHTTHNPGIGPLLQTVSWESARIAVQR
jgi:hypothetical protein